MILKKKIILFCSFLNDWINKCNNSDNIKETCSWKFKDLDQNNPIVQAIRMILIKNNLNPDNIELSPQTVQENDGNLVFMKKQVLLMYYIYMAR